MGETRVAKRKREPKRERERESAPVEKEETHTGLSSRRALSYAPRVGVSSNVRRTRNLLRRKQYRLREPSLESRPGAASKEEGETAALSVPDKRRKNFLAFTAHGPNGIPGDPRDLRAEAPMGREGEGGRKNPLERRTTTWRGHRIFLLR